MSGQRYPRSPLCGQHWPSSFLSRVVRSSLSFLSKPTTRRLFLGARAGFWSLGAPLVAVRVLARKKTLHPKVSPDGVVHYFSSTYGVASGPHQVKDSPTCPLSSSLTSSAHIFGKHPLEAELSWGMDGSWFRKWHGLGNNGGISLINS